MISFAATERLLALAAVACLAWFGPRGLRTGPSLELLALAALVVGWADPRWIAESQPQVRPQTPIVVVVDASTSMQVRDCGGRSRSQIASDLLVSLAASLPDQPLAVLAVADRVRTVRPISRDRLAATQTGPFWPDAGLGSNLAIAIEDAADLVLPSKDGPAGLLLLLTDGESHDDGPDEASLASAAAALDRIGIEPFAVVVGTADGGPVPSIDDPERTLRFDGRPISSAATTAALDAAGLDPVGPVDRAETATVQPIVDRALQLDRRAAIRAGEPLFPLAVLVAIACVLLPRVRDRRLLVALCGLSLCGQAANTGRAPAETATAEATSGYFASRRALNDGIEAAARGDWDAAAERFAAARSSTRFADVAAFNLGVAGVRQFEQSGDREAMERAIDAYRAALRHRPDWPKARRNLQAAYRLLRQSGSPTPPEDPSEGDATDDRRGGGSGNGQEGKRDGGESAASGPPDEPPAVDAEEQVHGAATSPRASEDGSGPDGRGRVGKPW